jgi:hypothetical protein
LHPDLAIGDSLLGEHQLGVSERMMSRPDRNQVLQVSADQQGGFVRCFRNQGLWAFNANWVPFRWHRHVTGPEFKQLSSEWPEPLPGMLLNTPPSAVSHAREPDTEPEMLGLKGTTSEASPPNLSAALEALNKRLREGSK